MSTQFRFVMHSAKAHAFELASESPRNGLAQRGLAHARSAHQAKNRSFGSGFSFRTASCSIMPLFDFGDAEMILIQNLRGKLQVQSIVVRLVHGSSIT